jgi:hypothetical protein
MAAVVNFEDASSTAARLPKPPPNASIATNSSGNSFSTVARSPPNQARQTASRASSSLFFSPSPLRGVLVHPLQRLRGQVGVSSHDGMIMKIELANDRRFAHTYIVGERQRVISTVAIRLSSNNSRDRSATSRGRHADNLKVAQ